MNFNLSRKGIRNIRFYFSYSWIFEGKKQQWKYLWSRRLRISHSLPQRLCGIQGIMHGVVIYWSSLCASLFNILLSVRTELCQSIVHSFCTQFTFHMNLFQLKRETSRTITFGLHEATKFVENYRFYSVCFVGRKVQIKPSIECHFFLLTENL